jgi:pimeloyl-ACP methyl ester carboxylesterase
LQFLTIEEADSGVILRAMKNPLRFAFLFVATALLLLQVCFKRYILTDKEIERHYSNQSSKPRFDYFNISDTSGVYYAESGADTLPLVVFLHGAPGAWYGYMSYIDDTMLREKINMIAVDRPGYGKSHSEQKVTSIADQVRWLYPLIAAKKKGRPVLIVGRSYGAPIAARLAAEFPDVVDALLLIAPAADPNLEKFWWFSRPINSKLMRWMFPQPINRASDEKFTHVQELKIMESYWKQIRIPVTVVQGDADQIVDTANMNFVRRMLPSDSLSRFIRLPGVGHLVTNERPEFVRELLLSAIERVRR